MANDNDAVILSAARTPIGRFQGALSSIPATQLGAIAVKAAVERAGINPEEIEEVIMGLPNVVDVAVLGEPHPLLGQIIVARIAVAEPERAAEQFIGMLSGRVQLRALLGVAETLGKTELDSRVDEAVTSFLTLYAPARTLGTAVGAR